MSWGVTGGKGQLGTALKRLSVDGCGMEFETRSHQELDITDEAEVDRSIRQHGWEGVINTAAYNFVDRAETEISEARMLNEQGPLNLSRACEKYRIPLVQVSTDYVFDGDAKHPYIETDAVEPRGVYGRSKLGGEKAVLQECSRAYVVRTCGVYGKAESVGKGNFVETMLRLAKERDELRVVNDQRCCPTSSKELARGIAALIGTEKYGVYHLTCAGDCTWYEFAVEILRQSNLKTRVVPISTLEFGAKSARPAYSVLNCDKLEEASGFRAKPWREALKEYLRDRETSV